MNQIRKDFLIERYSIISEVRGKRPHDFCEKTGKKKGEICFFCPGSEKLTPRTIDRFPANGPWRIRVFRNKFPALRPPNGEHEIIVETNKHGKGMEGLEPEEIVQVFLMYEKRRKALERRYRYASIFKNEGRDAGASLAHSHTQILAGSLLPTIVAQESEAAKSYYQKWHRCPWCEYIKNIENKRIAAENKNSIAITANAPRFPYEVWITPKRHVGNFSDLKQAEALDFCFTLKKMLTKIHKELCGPSYNFAVHCAPKGQSKWYHFHVEIMPRVSVHAGYELGGGVYITSASPETAARFYRS
jgi:UDPglucose--hexose-1-phosphate uridylyltransferase